MTDWNANKRIEFTNDDRRALLENLAHESPTWLQEYLGKRDSKRGLYMLDKDGDYVCAGCDDVDCDDCYMDAVEADLDGIGYGDTHSERQPTFDEVNAALNAGEIEVKDNLDMVVTEGQKKFRWSREDSRWIDISNEADALEGDLPDLRNTRSHRTTALAATPTPTTPAKGYAYNYSDDDWSNGWVYSSNTGWKNAGGRHAFCDHWRQEVQLLNNLVIKASGYFDRPGVAVPPMATDIGLYFDDAWGQGILATPGVDIPGLDTKGHRVILPWPDYGVPASVRQTRTVFLWVLKQLKAGKTVEIGCLGGHGRTGTCLASLLVLQGMNPKKAIRRIRTRYCQNAIEGTAQESMVFQMKGN